MSNLQGIFQDSWGKLIILYKVEPEFRYERVSDVIIGSFRCPYLPSKGVSYQSKLLAFSNRKRKSHDQCGFHAQPIS